MMEPHSTRTKHTRRLPQGASWRRLRDALERLRTETIRDQRIEHDPLGTVLDYATPEDRELVGLIAALLAYGRVDRFRAHTRQVLASMGRHPGRRLREAVPALGPLRYRFHRSRDLRALLRGIRTVLLRSGSLGEAFASGWRATGELRPSLERFAEEIRSAAGQGGPGLRYLLADPALGGACKRWLLYLRWMVRDGGREETDPGDWSRLVPAASLIVPLDTHLVRISRRLGLTGRRSPGWKMAEEVTSSLRRLDPNDPVRYDFPLCHLGIAGTCPPHLTPDHCRRCPLGDVCPTGRSASRTGWIRSLT